MTAPDYLSQMDVAAIGPGRYLVTKYDGSQCPAAVVDVHGETPTVRMLDSGGDVITRWEALHKLAVVLPADQREVHVAASEARQDGADTGQAEPSAAPQADPQPEPEPDSTADSGAEADTSDSKQELQTKVATALSARGAPMQHVTLGWRENGDVEEVVLEDDWQAMDEDQRDAWQEATDADWVDIDWAQNGDGDWVPEEKVVTSKTVAENPEVFG